MCILKMLIYCYIVVVPCREILNLQDHAWWVLLILLFLVVRWLLLTTRLFSHYAVTSVRRERVIGFTIVYSQNGKQYGYALLDAL